MEDELSVQAILNKQREESEAREIVKDIGNLHSLPSEKRGRWIWELLQNARDCANDSELEGKSYVNIEITLQADKIIFQHDGKPFPLPELIALFRRTSTKGVTGQQGMTGKYGTGFVTTHVLSKIVYVKGYILLRQGLKMFDLKMDRSFDEIPEMQKELENVFKSITEIQNFSEYSTPEKISTEFTFPLSNKSLPIAQHTTEELLSNIYFTMLCNSAIKTVRLQNFTTNKSYTIALVDPEYIDEKISYYQTAIETTEEREKGIFLYKEDELFLIGLPVEKSEDRFSIIELGNQARFYKELPLIGTEQSNVPYFIQSRYFQPPEPRDGLRIQKDDEEKADKIADENRKILSQLPKSLIDFFTRVQNINIQNLHLLTESGLPIDRFNYLDPDWYVNNIQRPLRNFYESLDIVHTVSGHMKPIKDCYFSFCENAQFEGIFYELVSELQPELFPAKEFWYSWNKIIYQQPENWVENIIFDLSNLIEKVASYKKLENFPFDSDDTLIWLNRFYDYLKSTQKLSATDTSELFLSQAGTLELRANLKVDTIRSEDLKSITEVFGHPVRNRLLHNKIEFNEGIENFKFDEFIPNFHKTLGTTKPENLSPEQITALLHLTSLFRTIKSPVRKKLYDLVKELFEEKMPDIKEVDNLEEYNWDTPDELITKYVCYLIQKCAKLSVFVDEYFNKNENAAIIWLNKFYEFLTGREDYRKIREDYKIFLTQSGSFNSLREVKYEDSSRPFEDLFKDLFRDYLNGKDPYDFLIDRRISQLDFELVDQHYLTIPVDNLFSPSDAENKVMEGKPYNDLFHKINRYVKTQSVSIANSFFPSFMKNQAVLLLKAMGPEISNRVMILQQMNRNDDELREMSKLTLSVTELSLLEQAALKVGTTVILDKVNEMQIASQQAIWRKLVGTRAENAFLEAIKDIKAHLIEIENPDEGCDYVLSLQQGEKLQYSIEIKSVGVGIERAKMSMRQGNAASSSPSNYALCVVSRDENDNVSVQDFINNAKFIHNIGDLIKGKVDLAKSDITELTNHEEGDISVIFQNKQYSINVRKPVWEEALDFTSFVKLLHEYFGITENRNK